MGRFFYFIFSCDIRNGFIPVNPGILPFIEKYFALVLKCSILYTSIQGEGFLNQEMRVPVGG